MLDLLYSFLHHDQKCSCLEEELVCGDCGQKMTFVGPKVIRKMPSALALGVSLCGSDQARVPLLLEEEIDLQFIANPKANHLFSSALESRESASFVTDKTKTFISESQGFKEIQTTNQSAAKAVVDHNQFRKPFKSNLFVSNIINGREIDTGLPAPREKTPIQSKQSYKYHLRGIIAQEAASIDAQEYIVIIKHKNNWVEMNRQTQSVHSNFQAVSQQKLRPVLLLYQQFQEKTAIQSNI